MTNKWNIITTNDNCPYRIRMMINWEYEFGCCCNDRRAAEYECCERNCKVKGML